MKVFNIVTVALAMTLPGLLSAQDFRTGYIVKPANDTIRGLVSYRSGRKIPVCEFKSNKDALVQQFTADELVAYEVELTRYERVLIDSDTMPRGNVFMRVLAKGAIDLYRYRRFLFVYKEGLYGLPEPLIEIVARPGVLDGSKYTQKDSRFIVILNQIIQDCGMNANETGYNEGDMVKLITSYNKCKKDNIEIPKEKFLRTNAQAFVAYGGSSMNYDYRVAHVPFDLCLRPSFGLGIEFSSPVVSDRLFLAFELWGAHSFYQGYDERVSSQGSTLRQDFLLDLTHIKIPIGAGFHFQSQKRTFYVKGGLAFGRVLKSELRIIGETEFPSGDVYSEGIASADYFVKTNPRTAWLGGGYMMEIGKFRWFAELRSEFGGGFVGDYFDSKSTIREVNMIIGIRI